MIAQHFANGAGKAASVCRIPWLRLLVVAVSASAFSWHHQKWSHSRGIDCRRTNQRLVGDRTAVSASTGGDDIDVTMIRFILWNMTRFFSAMVDCQPQDERSSRINCRFFYICRPQKEERHHFHMPIRDLAAAWDATKALQFWKQHRTYLREEEEEDYDENYRLLGDAVAGTYRYYSASFSSIYSDSTTQMTALSLDPGILREPPNIAHSALLLLTISGSLRLSLLEQQGSYDGDCGALSIMDGLTRGILSMQRSDGAFHPEFGDKKIRDVNSVLWRVEFFPGEAMVALMDVFEFSSASTRRGILTAMENAFCFYSNLYYEGNMDINFNIWQIQAFSRYYCNIRETKTNAFLGQTASISQYILEMCHDLMNSNSWRYELSRGSSFYPNLSTIEITCGLDALADALRVAELVEDLVTESQIRRNIKNGLDFIGWAQDRLPTDATVGKGGLGHGGSQILEQRMDVTGHAISALTKLHTTLRVKNS